MRRKLRHMTAIVGVTVIACIAFCALALSAVAADSPKVSGADYYTTSAPVDARSANGAANSIDVLYVEGAPGSTIFVEVEKDGELAASRLTYKLGENEDAGVVKIENINAEQASSGLVVRAYSDRAGKTLLYYEGTVQPVYASYDGAPGALVALRTVAADESRSFTPEETIFANATNYRLERDASGNPVVSDNGGSLTYSYLSYNPEASVDGSVTYVDTQGNTIRKDAIVGIATGTSQTRAIPAVVRGEDGSAYRTIFYGNSVTATNPGQRDFVIRCSKIDVTESGANGFYVATINLVDAAGNLLASDSVTVTGKYTYTAPLSIYMDRNGVSVTYDIADKNAQIINMDAATEDGVTSGAKTYTVVYNEQPANPAEVTVTFNIIDGTKNMGEGASNDVRFLASPETATVTVENPIAYPSQESIMVDGKQYVVAGGMDMYAYNFAEGGTPVINVYYVPADYVAPGPYDVTVQYVNLADNSVITTKTVEASPDLLQNLEIPTDAELSVDGVDYVRLDGQEEPISHNYYSNARTYTVYYRNVNDDLSAQTVVTHIRVTYADGTTAALGEAAAPEGDATAVALDAADTFNAIVGPDGGLLTNQDGVDTNTERIEDEANPLASGAENEGAMSLGAAVPVIIGVAIAAAVAIVLVIVLKRRKKEETGVK